MPKTVVLMMVMMMIIIMMMAMMVRVSVKLVKNVMAIIM